MQRVLRGAAIAAVSWAVGYFAMKWLAAGTSAASGYGELSGWWLTAYTSARTGVPVWSVGPLFVAYLAFFVVVYLAGSSALYRDAASISLTSAVAIGVVQSIVVISPILFDVVVRRIAALSSPSRG